MRDTVTLAELQIEGVLPAPHEAVAIALTLMEGQLWGNATAPDGRGASTLPSPSTISLAADGSVLCADPITKLSAADVAILLQEMLEDTPRVPPGLLYAIARALRAVEAPPFESPEALFTALARFERGPRRDVLADLVARFDAALDSRDRDRRRPDRRALPPLVAHLRRELRAVDRREYEQQPIPAAAPSAAPGLRRRFGPVAIGVCLAAGLACFAAGAVIDIDRTPAEIGPKTAPAVAEVDRAAAADRAVEVSANRAPVAPPAVPISVAVTPASAPPASRDTPHRPAATNHRPTNGRTSGRSRADAAHPRKSSRLGAALRFEWVRHLIKVRDDL